MKKILIVSAEPSVRDAAYKALNGKYNAVCAASAIEALELFGREKPDLTLCELDLPQMSGIELQRLLCERQREQLPFLFLSAAGNEDAECRVLNAGAIDFVSYPFRPEVLLRRTSNAIRQIDSLRQLQGLRIVAESDPMTGLLNKVFVQRTLAELCARASGILMMIDLDNFKLVNDLYGHGMGDRLLIRFSDILRGVIRSADDVVGRVGGDEFIVFCRDVRSEHLVAEKTATINASLLESAREYMGADMNIPLGVSVGAVVVPDEGTDFADLFQKADKALYVAKQRGKHGYSFFREREAPGVSMPRSETPSLIGARAALDERNRPKGAYEVDFDHFGSVYRFIARRIESYHYDVEFVLFTFAEDVSEDKMCAFGGLLRQSLRRSDVFTRSSRSQFMVLLPQPSPDCGDAAIRRVMERWRLLDGETDVICEHEPIASDRQ